MTLKELETRVAELEKTVAELKAQLANGKTEQRHWWHEDAGRFANDPVFDEIVRLGKEYRDSLHPDYKKKKKAAKKKGAKK
jgi:hypothetical protein